MTLLSLTKHIDELTHNSSKSKYSEPKIKKIQGLVRGLTSSTCINFSIGIKDNSPP